MLGCSIAIALVVFQLNQCAICVLALAIQVDKGRRFGYFTVAFQVLYGRLSELIGRLERDFGAHEMIVMMLDVLIALGDLTKNACVYRLNWISSQIDLFDIDKRM